MILQRRENPIIATSPAPVAQAATLRQEQQSPQAAPAGDDDSRSTSTPCSASTARKPVGATTTPTPEAAVTQQNRDESPAVLTFQITQWLV